MSSSPGFFWFHPFFGVSPPVPRCLRGRDLKSFVSEDALAKVAKRFSRRVALSQWDPDVVARNLLLEKDGGHRDTTPGTAFGADVDRLTWKGEKRRG